MTIDKIGQAISEEIARLERQIKFYRTLVHIPPTEHARKRVAKTAPKKRTMSKAARALISEAQRKRWAKQKKEAK